MSIPTPTLPMLGWACLIAGFVLVSRCVTVFPLLYRLKMGLRISVLTSLYLSQISEFSLVILALGVSAQHVSSGALGVMTYAFVLLAVASTYAMVHAERLAHWTLSWLPRWGLTDLKSEPETRADAPQPPTIYLLGLYHIGSSLLAELERTEPQWLPRLAVIDFNPLVYVRLRERGVRILYGDISQRDTLLHAGVDQAEVIVNTLTDTVLKGTTNQRLVRQLRELNPHAQLIVLSEKTTEVDSLYAAGADYVVLPRLLAATELRSAIDAARDKLLAEKRAAVERALAERHEVLPA